MGSHMALGVNTGHGHQCGPQLQQDIGSKHGPQWQYEVTYINMILGGSTGHTHQHGLLVVAQPSDITVI